MSQKLFALKDALNNLTLAEISTWADDDVLNLMEVTRAIMQKTADMAPPLTFGVTREELELIKQRKHIHAVKEIKTRTGMSLADAKALADDARSKLSPSDFVEPPELL